MTVFAHEGSNNDSIASEYSSPILRWLKIKAVSECFSKITNPRGVRHRDRSGALMSRFFNSFKIGPSGAIAASARAPIQSRILSDRSVTIVGVHDVAMPIPGPMNTSLSITIGELMPWRRSFAMCSLGNWASGASMPCNLNCSMNSGQFWRTVNMRSLSENRLSSSCCLTSIKPTVSPIKRANSSQDSPVLHSRDEKNWPEGIGMSVICRWVIPQSAHRRSVRFERF